MRRVWVAATILGLAVAAVLALPSLGRAQVTGTTPDAAAGRGQTAIAEMTLSADAAVNGINGEVNYDARVLSNPRVYPGLGALDFMVLGKVADPGDAHTSGTFRFLIYKTPKHGNLSLRRPVVKFLFDITGPSEGGTIVTFTESAAARVISEIPPSVVSIALGGPGGTPPAEQVTFEPFSIQVPTDVRTWPLYD